MAGPESLSTTTQAPGLGGYVALSTRERYAVCALCVVLLANVASIVVDIAVLPLLDDPTNLDALHRYDSATGAAGIAQGLTLLLAAVFFIRWFNAAHRNLDAACPGVRRHATWWSIGGWFIPIMALFRPKQILNDILACALASRRRPWWASTWWGLWLVGSIGGYAAGRASAGASTLDQIRSATIADAATAAISVLGAIAAIIVVRRVTKALDLTRHNATAPAAVSLPAGSEFPSAT